MGRGRHRRCLAQVERAVIKAGKGGGGGGFGHGEVFYSITYGRASAGMPGGAGDKGMGFKD